MIPVRGQLARMIPQTDIHYGLSYKNVGLIPRRDELVLQVFGENDYFGFNDDTTYPIAPRRNMRLTPSPDSTRKKLITLYH